MDSKSAISQGKRGELQTVIVDNPFASCEVALYGGHVISYVPKSDNRDRLWLSPHADLTGNKPIRGGIPICWPWFSDNKPVDDASLASHGYMRNQYWSLVSHSETEQGTEVIFEPGTTRVPGFEHEVTLSLSVIVGKQLIVALHTTNNSDYSVDFGGALHSYFSVDKVTNTTLNGISGSYKDKLDNYAVKSTPTPYNIIGETDRVHLCTAEKTSIQWPSAITEIEHNGHDSIVVWNPWMGAASMPDMDAFAYKNMLCVETALTLGKTLQPAQTHSLIQRVS